MVGRTQTEKGHRRREGKRAGGSQQLGGERGTTLEAEQKH